MLGEKFQGILAFRKNYGHTEVESAPLLYRSMYYEIWDRIQLANTLSNLCSAEINIIIPPREKKSNIDFEKKKLVLTITEIKGERWEIVFTN